VIQCINGFILVGDNPVWTGQSTNMGGKASIEVVFSLKIQI